MIGNIQRDCNSARKYWHFIKLMGRSASHIALECALQTHPNVCIISEEVEANDLSLDEIVNRIARVVARRAAEGNNFGTVLIPEGLIEFIPAMKRLIAELNDFLARNKAEFKMIKKSVRHSYLISKLSKENAALYASLPEGVARQLALDRDPHGNVQVSLIETEKLLAEMVDNRLSEWKEEGRYRGKFATQMHFFGYEGRCAAELRRRLLLLARLCRLVPHPRRQDRLHGLRAQHHRAGRGVDRWRYPHHNDDEHGAARRRHEARHP